MNLTRTAIHTARRTLFSLAAAALLGLALLTPALAQAPAPELASVLHQMDDASHKFQSAQADFRWDIYERVIKETTTQTGTIYFIKKNGTLQMGAKIDPPNARFFEYKDGKVAIFDPTANHLTQISAAGQYEGFLTLGFGGSGTDLAKSWNITYQGTEPISDGKATIKTDKLDLVSKDPNARNTFTHILIWVDPTRGISLKQQFFTPSGDQRTTYYSNIRYNQSINTKPYEIKTDKKTTIDRR
jgi:outer membrane lipoprotein-sorting protein